MSAWKQRKSCTKKLENNICSRYVAGNMGSPIYVADSIGRLDGNNYPNEINDIVSENRCCLKKKMHQGIKTEHQTLRID